MKKKGFTLIEILLVMVIMGILMTVVFVGIGKQREKAKVSSMLQVAGSVLPLARDCYFRNRSLDNPTSDKGGGDICTVVKAQWPIIKVTECVYQNFDAVNRSYGIVCADFGKKIACGVDSANYGCKEEDIP